MLYVHASPLIPPHSAVLLVPAPLSILFAKRNEQWCSYLLESACAVQVNADVDTIDIHAEAYFNSPLALL